VDAEDEDERADSEEVDEQTDAKEKGGLVNEGRSSSR
jgi:hypothetical protein